MTFTSRPLQPETDLPALAALIGSLPADHHAVDFPYRLCSPSVHEPAHTQVWHDASGRLVGAALIQGQFWVMDWYIHPQVAFGSLAPAIWGWATRQLSILAREFSEPLGFFFDARSDDSERIAFLEAQGCQRSDWEQWYMTQAVKHAAPPTLPAGFTIRSLAADEAAAYTALHRAAFGSQNMTEAWRARTLSMPQYRAAVDLVAVAPDGRLAAFCVWWLDERQRAQIEPLGTHPDFRQRGLAQALIGEGLRRLREHNVQTAIVDVDNNNPRGYALYESVGFRREQTIYKYRQEFNATPLDEE